MGYLILLFLIMGAVVWLAKKLFDYWFIIVAVIALFVIYEVIFWLTHRRPLTEEEIKKLSEVRKIVYINRIFQFSHNKVKVNPAYRASLDKEGRWDRIDIDIRGTPALITELLRYKRHEWSVWCLTDEEKSKFIWANKGDDNESCYFKGSIHHLTSLAKEAACNTVIHFHNHPHTAERTWNLLTPSKQDMKTLRAMSETFEKEGLNYISALCSQGKFVFYGSSFAPQYYPKGTSTTEIKKENGINPGMNYKLHRELRKHKNASIKPIR